MHSSLSSSPALFFPFMGSLEAGVPLKRNPLAGSASFAYAGGGGRSLFHRTRSRLARAVLFEKFDYLQWILTAAAFYFVVILFQAFLPGLALDKSRGRSILDEGRSLLPGNFRGLDFGEGIRFVPAKLLERIERERKEADSASVVLGRVLKRTGLRKPRLALIVGGFSPDAMQLQMISIAAVLKETGYEIEVVSLEDGPMHAAWRNLGMRLIVLPKYLKNEITIDWLDYNGILVSSAEGLVLSRVCILWRESFIHMPSPSVEIADFLHPLLPSLDNISD